MQKVLFGGLTKAHEILFKGFFKHLGYVVESLPEPDNEALKIGKIYCNKGQCNPVYYTAGNIIKYLFNLRNRGEKDIDKNYLFITASSYGPCRFGMYETEYRRALKEAGFDNLTIIALQQDEALLNDLKEKGFNLSRNEFFRLLKPLILADLINNIFYKTKPYEIISESMDKWKEKSLHKLYQALKGGSSLVKPIRQLKKDLDHIELDYFRTKPKVKITGEFFSQIQEGEANYRLLGWLVEEGAEPVVEPITTWLDYLIRGKIHFTRERAFRSRANAGKIILTISILKLYIHTVYRLYRFLFGNKPDLLTSQKKLAEYAKNYYSPKLMGGEGHLEVGEHIYNIKHKKAHMVISVKPFGCMSSTQSDGVQTKVAYDLKESLFVSVDTSGDAEVNFKSRVLMKLHEARIKAAMEYETVKKRLHLHIDNNDIERLKAKKSDIKKASLVLPQQGTSTAVNALYFISS